MKTSQLQHELGGRFITDPETQLGPNYETVLNFWLFLDTLSKEQMESIGQKYSRLEMDNRFPNKISEYASKVLANECDVWQDVASQSYHLFYPIEFRISLTWATHEIICMHKLIEDDVPIVVLPLFRCDT